LTWIRSVLKLIQLTHFEFHQFQPFTPIMSLSLDTVIRILNAMKSPFPFLLALALIVGGCDEPDPHRDTLEYFQLYLTPEMKFDNLQKTFGNPDGDVGSGVHIYIYNLSDGTKIQIGYTDSILYANQLDNGNQLLLSLI
jgi:hypothetical protein